MNTVERVHAGEQGSTCPGLCEEQRGTQTNREVPRQTRSKVEGHKHRANRTIEDMIEAAKQA